MRDLEYAAGQNTGKNKGVDIWFLSVFVCIHVNTRVYMYARVCICTCVCMCMRGEVTCTFSRHSMRCDLGFLTNI